MSKEQEILEKYKALHIGGVSGSFSLEEIEKLAHKNFTYGSKMPIGSRDRSLYENRKEAFIAGFNEGLNYR
jgi:hypothetical protein